MNQTSCFKLLAALLAMLLLAACAAPSATFPPETAPITAGGTASADPTAIALSAPGVRTVQSSEFGVALSYAESLAASATIQQVEAAPMSQDRMYVEAHPAYISVAFGGIPTQRAYRLTHPISQPQVMIFRTADFASYGPDSSNGFPAQQSKLAVLLKDGIDPRYCTTPPRSVEDHLPYLPWTNAAQAFCAQLKTLEFGPADGPSHSRGSGIRYLTTYAQGINVVLEGEVFYTFQGLTNDGQYYISMVYPVETGVFEATAPSAAELKALTLDGIRNQLAGQIVTLNGMNAQNFTPPLDKLDAVIESIELP